MIPTPIKDCIICIPTYQRLELLVRLINDIKNQTLQPKTIVIVDGDPDSGDVLAMLKDYESSTTLSFLYVPSNHANLAYQRYLGWRVAKTEDCRILLYLDDDLHIEQQDAVEKVIPPLQQESDVVGVTARILMGDAEDKLRDQAVLVDRALQAKRSKSKLVQWFGASRHVKPGELSPTGQRRKPKMSDNEYETVEWLRGGVMVLRIAALDERVFSNDLFAMYEKGLGKGEDTFFSRLVGTRGQLLSAMNAEFQHPNDVSPTAYPTNAYQLGYTTAYSRRLLNDYYRGFDPPKLSDRYVLVKSYLGNTLLNIYRVVTRPARHRFAYAAGYFLGAVRGLIQKPTARNLTPEINWRQDADEALQNVKRIEKDT